MTRPRLLVVTTVHRPDDPRIRAKLIPTLAAEWEVTYASPAPGPTDRAGLDTVDLAGSRGRRLLRAALLLVSRRWDLVAIHDPELLLPGMVRALLRRPVVFDLHENLPQQLLTRAGGIAALRRPLSRLAGWVLHRAERMLTVTLAEPGYASLFRRHHPVIANHLPLTLPAPQPEADPPFLAYLGDITVARGAFLALEAAAGAGARLVMVGRVAPPELASRLRARAGELGVELELTGPLPHPRALDRIAPARAGLSPLLDLGNYRHSLPTKVPEYLALGIPALVADLPGTREPTRGLAGLIFVPPGAAEEWREAGGRLAAAGLREAASAQVGEVRRRFSWDPETVLAAYRTALRR